MSLLQIPVPVYNYRYYYSLSQTQVCFFTEPHTGFGRYQCSMNFWLQIFYFFVLILSLSYIICPLLYIRHAHLLFFCFRFCYIPLSSVWRKSWVFPCFADITMSSLYGSGLVEWSWFCGLPDSHESGKILPDVHEWYSHVILILANVLYTEWSRLVVLNMRGVFAD